MKYFKLLALPIPRDSQPVAVYRGLEQDKADIGPGYFQVRQMLVGLMDWAGQHEDEQEFHLVYQYQREVLGVYAGVPNDAETLLKASLPGAEWSKPCELPTPPSHGIDLTGAADPCVLDERPESLLDELLDGLHDREFTLHFTIRSVAEGRLQRHLAEQERRIQKLSRERSINLSELEPIGRNIIQIFDGGESRSYTEEHAQADVDFQKAKQHYLAIHAASDRACTLAIAVRAPQPSIARNLGHRIQAFSTLAGVPTLHLVRAIEPEESCDDLLPVTPAEVATLAALPFRARTGLVYRERVDFGVQPGEVGGGAIELGHLEVPQPTHLPVAVARGALTRHALVTGVTGSGKTNTVMRLLNECGVPFLVIEPAKSEYRRLDGVRVWRLGGYTGKPLHMNPLAFPAGVHVQTHLDLVKAVFNAAFPMYGPMPYLLETAILKIYQRRGWDLVTGKNVYYGEPPGDRSDDAFPTLAELRDELDAVVDAAGYAGEQTSNVRAALKVRIGSLLGGAKGQLLNTRTRLDVDDLLARNTVLELEAIGDGQEKVFLMGLLLIQVYEHYVAKGEAADGILRHLLVFEEAHRLWENRQEAASQETADVKGHAVQTMNQILAEIRAYGQGVIVADQIPSKLAPDVVKNTNLKVLHRLFAQDDYREWVGRAIGLDDEQVEHLVHLRTGHAVVFWDELDEAVRVHVHESRRADREALPPDTEPSPGEAELQYLLADADFVAAARRVLATVVLGLIPLERVPPLLAERAQRRLPKPLPANPHWTARIVLRAGLELAQAWQGRGLLTPLDASRVESLLSTAADPIAALASVARGLGVPRAALAERFAPAAMLFPTLVPPEWAEARRWLKVLARLGYRPGGEALTYTTPDRYARLAPALALGKWFDLEALDTAGRATLIDAAVLSLALGYDLGAAKLYLRVRNHAMDGEATLRHLPLRAELPAAPSSRPSAPSYGAAAEAAVAMERVVGRTFAEQRGYLARFLWLVGAETLVLALVLWLALRR